MKLLAIDIGSSSIKCAILTGERAPKSIPRAPYPTRYDGTRAEVEERSILRALSEALKQLDAIDQVDAIVPTAMAPSWLAMDARGKAITPIVTHQDRRAIVEAKFIEARVGRARHLALCGNRPFPGGISSTTWRWFARHEKPTMKRAALVGHVSTWLIRQLTGQRITDPSNAGFMGVYDTSKLSEWSDELIDGAGVSRKLLPEVREANQIAGHVTTEGARRFGLLEGTPVLAGCMDGSAAMLASGAKVGQLLNVSGSTDVLALVVDQFRPHEKLLTRPLGVDGKWLAVATISAAGSALAWAQRTLFAELSPSQFFKRLPAIARAGSNGVSFAPDLAGSRMSIDEISGAIMNLRLGSTREHIVAALCESLAKMSADRLGLLRKQYKKIDRRVVVTGGVETGLAGVLRKHWRDHGEWSFKSIDEATLAGLWALAE